MQSITIKDVAREAGVSTATVSRVLNRNGYVSHEVRQQVLAVVKRLNYQPNALARSLKQERTRTVGMVLPDMTNPYFMAVARTIQRRLLAHGYRLFYMDCDEDAEREREAIRVLQEMRTEAVILAGTGGNADAVARMIEAGRTVVLIDRTIDGIRADAVTDDNAGAADEAAAHLLGKYGPRFGIITGPRSTSTSRERAAGVKRALERAGCPSDPALWYEGDYTRRAGMEAGHYFLGMNEPPLAVFSFNNEMTYGFYLAMKQRGLPLDALEVVSFGELDAAPLFENRLSVIRQHPDQIGEAAADIVVSRLEGGAEGEPVQRVIMPALETASR
ncbi:LacI family DNA-binding transcriptional regulator [Paenibacillus cisolokensis]|uniref:LacI family DNA-binding transcriptional regulator n=1 Tax=Paenibacillus TaxID=44249 RepID=UPI0007222FC0|nr:LacI family DNA-binding transcriptional regulator [Paenibacillus sp. 32O-W]ALS29184.1 LacI family transcriptional regulator [Paenibacillus sp. 32O-W]